METAVAIDRNLVGLARCEHGIEVRGKSHVGRFAEGRRDVAGPIEGGVPTEGAQLIDEPGGALLFEQRRGRNAAQRQVDLVNPLLLPREPHQPVAHTAERGPFVDIDPSGGVDSHLFRV